MGFRIPDILAAEEKYKNKECFKCGKKKAAVKCAQKGCKRTWHFTCGRYANCITQFIGEYKSYCNKHVPDTNRLTHNGTYCQVCFKYLQEYHPASSIFSDCCYDFCLQEQPEIYKSEEDVKQDKFVCYQCVQKYTVNAGYDSMCITCSMAPMEREDWQDQMRRKGIFVPQKMAEWEKMPHFKDLTKRRCIHPECPTPQKLSAVWTCRVCGCFPLHLQCAKVKDFKDYLCQKCIDQSFVNRVPII